MKLVGLMLARNEGWVLECTIPAAMQWVDSLVILDHASTDRTPQIIREMEERYPGRIVAMEEPAADRWDEMFHRQRTLEVGRKIGGTHFAIIDADEIVRHDSMAVLRKSIGDLTPGQVLQVPLYCMWRSPYLYRCDESVWGHAMLTFAFADDRTLSWQPRGDYHHHNRVPFGAKGKHARPFQSRSSAGVCHLQWVDWQRVTAKHAWYKMMERVRWGKDAASLNQIYGQALNETGIITCKVGGTWMSGWGDLLPMIRVGEPSWHVAECRRLLDEHGADTFAGLDLFGVV